MIKQFDCTILMNCVHKPSTLRAHFGDSKEQSPASSRSKRALARQFQQIKRQIQQFQDKNQAIIHRIRQVYNFRKKQPVQLYSSQISLSKEEYNQNNSVNGMCSPCENLICLPVTYKPFKNSERNKFSGEYPPVTTFIKDQPYNTLAMSAVYDYQAGKASNKQSQPQFQHYSIKPHHQLVEPSQKRRYSESKVRQNNFNVVQDTPTQQSEIYEEAENLYHSSAYSHQSQGGLQHDSIQRKTLMKNVKNMFENLFFTISEEYFGDKFLEMQRYVRRLENKIKRLAFQVRSFEEERKQNRQKSQFSKNNRSIPRTKVALKLEKKALNALSVGKELNIQNNNAAPKETVGYYQKIIKKLNNDIEQIQLQLKNENTKSETQRKEQEQQIQLQKKSIDQSRHNHLQQLNKVKESYEKERQVYRQKIKYLELKLSEQTVNEIKLKQSSKSLQGQKRKYEKNYQEIKEAYRLQTQQSKTKFDKLNKKYQQVFKEADNASKSLNQIRRKLLERQVEIYSLNAKLRTLQNQLLVKDDKISALHELLLLDQNSTQLHHHCNFTTKNSIIKIDFKDSNESIEGESDEQLHSISQCIQAKPIEQIKQQFQAQRESARRLNQDESNELISHNKILEDKFNKIYGEYSSLKQRNLELEKEIQRMRQDNDRLKEQSKNNQNKYKKTLKQHQIMKQQIQQTKQRALFLQKQLKMNKYQILQVQKANNTNTTHHSQKQGLLQSLQYSEMTIVQKNPQERQQQQLEQFENQLQLMMFQQQMQKKPHDQRLIHAEKEIIQKDQQLEMYLQEIEELKAELELVKSELKSSREDKKYGQEEKHRSNGSKCCRLDSIEPKEECGYRQSISFRLSVDPSDLVTTALGDSQGLVSALKQDQALTQKMKQSKNNRRDHIRLFEKTTTYIKNLKDIILEKAIHISCLENQLERMKQSEEQKLFLSGSRIVKPMIAKAYNGSDTESIHGSHQVGWDRDPHRSIDLSSKRYTSSTHHQTQEGRQLMLEQNKILLKEIQILQEELSRSQQQESSLIKIKDFYKEEVRRQQDLFLRKIQDKQREIRLIEQTREEQINQLKGVILKIGKVLLQDGTIRVDNPSSRVDIGQITQYFQKACGLLKISTIQPIRAKQ